MIFPEWLAYWECLDCGATWRSEIPPEGFLDIPDELGRRAFINEFMNKKHIHDCGMLGNGRARINNLMRSAGSFSLPTPKEAS